MGNDNSYFRILAGHLVKYIIVLPRTLPHSSLLEMPLDFINILPPLPYFEESWTVAHISRDNNGELQSALTKPKLAGVEATWHPKFIDVLDLKKIETLAMMVQMCTWQNNPPLHATDQTSFVAKFARFEWEVSYIENETRTYQMLEGTGIVPKFLGHIHENGRVIGFLLEKVDGRPAGIQDLTICTSALKLLHQHGILHGDCNPHNFLVTEDSKVILIDLANSKRNASKAELATELESLKGQLEDKSGRGGGWIAYEDDEE